MPRKLLSQMTPRERWYYTKRSQDRRRSLIGYPDLNRTQVVALPSATVSAARFPDRNAPVTLETRVRITENGGIHQGLIFEIGSSTSGLAIWIENQGIGVAAGGGPEATGFYDHGSELPVGLEFQLVVAVRPGDGRVKVWMNHSLILDLQAEALSLTDNQWFDGSDGSYASAPQGTVSSAVPASASTAPSGFEVVGPLRVYSGYLPQHFLSSDADIIPTPFDVSSLNPFAWYDPSDLSTLWQDVAGTSPVTADGQAVARMDDKSGYGYHAIQSTAARRALYRSNGDQSWLDFDGLDDYYELGTFAMPAALSCVFIYNNGGRRISIFVASDTSSPWAFVFTAGSVSDTVTRWFGPDGDEIDIFVNNASISPETRGAVYDAIEGRTSVLQFDSPTVGVTAPWRLGGSAFSGFEFGGRFYGMVLGQSIFSAHQRADLQTWAETKIPQFPSTVTPELRYDIFHRSTLWQDTSATSAINTDPLIAETQVVARIDDLSGNGRNAVQSAVAGRPVPSGQNIDPHLDFDGVDDALDVTVPAGGWSTQMLGATRRGTWFADVNIPAGTYTIGPYGMWHDLIGLVVGDMTTDERQAITRYYVSHGASRQAPSNMSNYFRQRTELTSLDLADIDFSNVTQIPFAFFNCSNLVTLDASNWNTSSFLNMFATFSGCSSLTALDASNWDTSNVISLVSTFQNCSSLTTLDVSNWDVANVTTFSGFVLGCASLTSLDISSWTTTATDFTNAFRSCAFDQATVDGILTRINAQSTNNGTLDIQGGTNAVPSSTGLAAKTSLESRGWTVNVNS